MTKQEEARHLELRSAAFRSAGAPAEAIAALQRAVSLYAAASGDGDHGDRARAGACRQLAELLIDSDRLPEAMQAFQEAADAYGRIPGAEGEAHACAQRILEGVRALWKRPEQRLYLLIARLDRERRQLAESPDSERVQADCIFRIATILQRRDRFAESAPRYLEALSLYERAPDSGLEQAACHHRLAGLYHYELDDATRAERHYLEAIRLYATFEPESEGEQMNRALCDQLLASLLHARR